MVAAVMAQLGGKRKLDPWEREDVEDVLDAAVEWMHDRMPLDVFANLGRVEVDTPVGRVASPGYTRFLALSASTAGDPRRRALLAAIDALAASNPEQVVTMSGIFTFDDVTRSGIKVR